MTNVNNHIDIAERRKLHEATEWGDIRRAAQLYLEATGKTISPNYLSKFLIGYRDGSSKIARMHQPIDMFAAITAAVAERQVRTQNANQRAAKLRDLIETIRRDTAPAQPIPA